MVGSLSTYGQYQTHKDSSTMDTGRVKKRGRPKGTWRRTIEQEMKYINQTWNGLGRLAQDRGNWRSAVDALCTAKCEED